MAEQVFADYPAIETASACLNGEADIAVTPDLLACADLICMMVTKHRARLLKNFMPHIRQARSVCLDSPDTCTFTDRVRILVACVPKFLPGL
jgi:predicted protein tyrosine phosphatase